MGFMASHRLGRSPRHIRARRRRLSRMAAALFALCALLAAPSEVAAQVGGGGGGSTTATTSTTNHSTFTDTSRTDAVDTFSTRITGRLDGGAILFDQTVAFAFGTPNVDALLDNALQAILNAALGQNPIIAGPNLVSSNTGLTDSQNSISQSLNHTETSVTTTTTFGPGTILIGEDQSQTFFVAAGTLNVNTNTHTESFIDRLFLTTETYLKTEHYELVGFPEQVATVAEPASMLLFGAGLMGLGFARRRRGRI